MNAWLITDISSLFFYLLIIREKKFLTTKEYSSFIELEEYMCSCLHLSALGSLVHRWFSWSSNQMYTHLSMHYASTVCLYIILYKMLSGFSFIFILKSRTPVLLKSWSHFSFTFLNTFLFIFYIFYFYFFIFSSIPLQL